MNQLDVRIVKHLATRHSKQSWHTYLFSPVTVAIGLVLVLCASIAFGTFFPFKSLGQTVCIFTGLASGLILFAWGIKKMGEENNGTH